MRTFYRLILVTLVNTFILLPASAATRTAPVSGFARSFILDRPIPHAVITILETGKKIMTDERGSFGPFQYPVGQPITLQLEKFEYKTTQTATVIVPPEGLTSPLNNMTFQVPSIESYYLLATVVGAKEDENFCHLAATITAFHKTMEDCPQGEIGATVSISPSVNETPFYFDVFRSGPLKDKTNPFTKNLTQTSEDGGVLIFNVPPSDKPYTITARKNGIVFSQATFTCQKGVFINVSPPLGPMALTSSK
jgi:hypothetical protein